MQTSRCKRGVGDLFSFSELEIISNKRYNDVYIFINIKADTLFYTKEQGVVALKSDTLEYYFDYIPFN